VVSHDPFINPDICNTGNTPLGDLSIYNLTYAQVAAFDCGSNGNPRFPEQQPISVHKPLLSTVIDTVEKLMATGKFHRVYYNIETKSKPETDDVMHPTPPVFAGMLYKLLKQKEILPYVTIQSFDPRTLREMKKLDATIPLVLLVENDKGYKTNVDSLGFVPQVYSPNYMLVDSITMQLAHQQKVLVLPWTVDDTTDMKHLIDLGVDGIITDRPDWAMALAAKLKIPVK
jgi:glycerophosphoryl diester phosphodiesterase